METKDILKFRINDHVILALKEQRYFDPTEGTREVELVSKYHMKRNLGIEEMHYEKYADKVFKENKIIPIKMFAGTYVGSRNDIIKIKPYYGLLSPEARYFIVPAEHIQRIEKIECVSD